MVTRIVKMTFEPSTCDDYRQSDTFGEVWPQTKALFSAPAEAWTCKEEYNL
jgi:hypothetical protein